MNTIKYKRLFESSGGSGSITGSGTSSFYAKWSDSTELSDALLSDDGTNVILPSGKFITSEDPTKIVMSFGTTGSEYWDVTTDEGVYTTPYFYLHPTEGAWLAGGETAYFNALPTGEFLMLHSNGFEIVSFPDFNSPFPAGVEVNSVRLRQATEMQFETGGITSQREAFIRTPTYAFVGASTITNAATLAIEGAPIAGTNATITNSYALWVQSGITKLDGNLTLSSTEFHTGITTSSGPGAVSVAGRIHQITTTGTGDALTLVNGTNGQRLTILYAAEGAGTDTAILTPTTLAGTATTITFAALGDSVELLYQTVGGWHVVGVNGAVIA